MNGPGVSVGLAWSPHGGDILFIEASITESGKPDDYSIQLTGNIGDVMKESVNTALTWMLATPEISKIDQSLVKGKKIHIHFPQGATPKDGPSAGIAVLTVLTSLLRKRPVRGTLAMTGEVSLRGKVLPIGGLRNKLMAAKQSGIKEVIIPEKNKKDLADLPDEIKNSLQIHIVSRMEEVLEIAFPTMSDPPLVDSAEPPARRSSKPKASKVSAEILSIESETE
jgi:ATP-dependent Lon protease